MSNFGMAFLLLVCEGRMADASGKTIIQPHPEHNRPAIAVTDLDLEAQARDMAKMLG